VRFVVGDTMLTDFGINLRLWDVIRFLHKVDPKNLEACDPIKTLIEVLRSPNQS
jgi:hypothetical protein